MHERTFVIKTRGVPEEFREDIAHQQPEAPDGTGRAAPTRSAPVDDRLPVEEAGGQGDADEPEDQR